MVLKGKKPEAIQSRLKMFVYGAAGSGKTTAAINFPNAYIIDCEHGAEKSKYIDLMTKSGAIHFSTNDYDELYKEVVELATTKHDRLTLVIDPITIIFNDSLEKAEKEVGTEFGRHYGQANKQWKHLHNLLMKLDLNIIITAHSKPVYGSKMEVIGHTYDAFKKMDFMMDLVVQLDVRGKARIGTVIKSRLAEFEQGEEFPFSYDEIRKRYADKSLEAPAKIIDLASQSQIDELERILNLIKDSEGTREKILKKEDAESLDQLSTQYIEVCISHLKKTLEGAK